MWLEAMPNWLLYFASLHRSPSFLDNLKSFCSSCTVPGTVIPLAAFNKYDDCRMIQGLTVTNQDMHFIKHQLCVLGRIQQVNDIFFMSQSLKLVLGLHPFRINCLS